MPRATPPPPVCHGRRAFGLAHRPGNRRQVSVHRDESWRLRRVEGPNAADHRVPRRPGQHRAPRRRRACRRCECGRREARVRAREGATAGRTHGAFVTTSVAAPWRSTGSYTAQATPGRAAVLGGRTPVSRARTPLKRCCDSLSRTHCTLRAGACGGLDCALRLATCSVRSLGTRCRRHTARRNVVGPVTALRRQDSRLV